MVHKYKFPQAFASRVASDSGHLKTPENADSILSFLEESGCSNTQLVRIVKCRPKVLACNLEGTIKPKLKILQDGGFSSDDICKMISNNPRILLSSVENYIIPSLTVLKGVLGSIYEVAKVLSLSSWLLSKNLEYILINIEFLKSCGIPMKRIHIVFTAFPCCFALNPEILRKSAEKVKEMGINASSQNFTYAIVTIAKMSNEGWELRLQAFRDLGVSQSDISAMFRRTPYVFNGSVKKIKKVIEVLLATGKFDINSIVNFPKSLAYSVEYRFIPRLQVLQILERRKCIEAWPALGTICSLSDGEFFMKFISPYSNEVSELCIMKSFTRVKKETN
ncbi:hypothetical protein ACS0TY_013364 [Phlomoides rotata]